VDAEPVLSRQDAKAITRRRLIDGALVLARTEGLTALTTGRIAAQAGLAQSSFYVHFADRASCLREMGDLVGHQILDSIRIAQKSLFSNLAKGDLQGANRAFHSAVFNALLNDPELIEVFLKLRRETSSPAGEGLHLLERSARDRVTDDMKSVGLDRAFGDDLGVFLDAVFGLIFGLTEGLLDGRNQNREAAIDMVARMTYPVLAEAVFRLGAPRA
jgi:AcrR family transcriptional regulator